MSLRDILNNATTQHPANWEEALKKAQALGWLSGRAPELAALCLDMGEALRSCDNLCSRRCADFNALLARLDELGAR